MKLLVTGGSGFIGSNFIRYMLEKHENLSVLNVDKLTYAALGDNLKDVKIRYPGRYSFFHGDISDDSKMYMVFGKEDFDYVVNFAAESHVDNSILDPSNFIDSNIKGIVNLLENLNDSNSRFLQVSTDEVYGSIGKDGKSWTEDNPLDPRSPYSISKGAADFFVRYYKDNYNIDAIITRCCNNYGPFQHPEKLIPRFITNLIDNKKVPLMGEGENIREWIHVLDHCTALEKVLLNGEPEIYNIGTGIEKTNREITDILLNHFGFGEDMIERIDHRKAHDFRYSVDFNKIKELGWKPLINFNSGIESTIEWYKNNEEWWRPLKESSEK